MILKQLKEKAMKKIKEDFRILDFSFALPYTYVVLEGPEGKAIGLAMTLPEEIGEYKTSFKSPSLKEFIDKTDSLNIIERTLGVATINAISQYYIDLTQSTSQDATDLIDDAKKIAVIGNMPPIVRTLKEKGKEIFVFERNPKLWDRETLSDSLEYYLLPEMDAVIVSGSALVNCTLNMIVKRSKKAKKIILTGATAQILPEFLKGSGVTHLASVKVIDMEKAILNLKMGSFRGFGEQSRKYVVEV
ncbi:MAG TPA: hypothetical protein ENG66_03750 [Thermococcus sp.]|nr:hypothetical protein [Thermococcus sp.]